MKSFFSKHVMAASGSLISCLFIGPFTSLAQEKQPFSNIHIGFCYPLSTNGSGAATYTNNVSFHILAGISKEERSFSVAGISNIVNDRVSGFQFAGISNLVKNRVEGVQIAGILNRSGNRTAGFQFAGIYNDTDTNDGFQLAGVLNRTKDVSGFQFAGFSNVVSSNAESFQAAGFCNIVGNRFRGFQFAGFMNKAQDIEGTQFAGFINIAKKVRGLQFAGFINIADSSDHPVALINIIKKGEMRLSLTTDEIQTTLISFRSGGRVLYGIAGAGVNWKTDSRAMAAEAGIGAHLPLSGTWGVNGELASLYLDDWKKGAYFKYSFRILPALKIGRLMELTGGPSVNFSQTNSGKYKDLIKSDLWHKSSGMNKYQLFIGYTAGMHLRLR